MTSQGPEAVLRDFDHGAIAAHALRADEFLQ